ncbi:MAG: hypothetical protein A2086_15775 [Spirochaetes bacterium GWD1_27_9]|nr:MAG: hypothetical protein A2Z98_11045 [Spirochaetes bacterium GWB1_27_13]OHD27095.1 MAG: hypothetical protein A2Y34_11395 [Spirochaetes bacterium GWC1_27_15]OHD42839.1 MAG: hypothetical protein A2086_15775 [Spirochaetes bacterium GWD1_27_9]
MKKKVLIIGAGISGLTVGNYLQMNGYETEIFEDHSLPGGLCTSWNRGDYTFDGCIHSIGGLNRKFILNKWFKEILPLDEMNFNYYDSLGLVVTPEGEKINLWTEPKKLEEELLRIAPEEHIFIKSLIRDIKALGNIDLMPKKPIELWNPLDYYLRQFISLPFLPYLIKWNKSLENVLSKIKNKNLKYALNLDFFKRFPMFFFVMSIGQLASKNSGYPIGGSYNFAKLFEKKYLSIGGKINYNSRVVKIDTESNIAKSIILKNGNIIKGDIIISASDGYNTIFNLLEGKFVDNKINNLYSKHPMFPSVVMVSLGINKNLSNLPSVITLFQKTPIVVDDKTNVYEIPIQIYNYDSTLAPENKTCVRVILHTHNYQYWKNLKENEKEKYMMEKKRIADSIIKIADDYLGDIKEHIEEIDVVTPVTINKYTSNRFGSIQGWEWLPSVIPELISKKLPKLKNFYLTGQWVMPGGGITGAFITGRDLARIICAKDFKIFKTKKK